METKFVPSDFNGSRRTTSRLEFGLSPLPAVELLGSYVSTKDCLLFPNCFHLPSLFF
ncbi:unnamed protein product [Musa acuminata var. zebrina]